MIDTVRYRKVITYSFVIALLVNLLYFIKVYSTEEFNLRNKALIHASSINYQTDDQITFPDNINYNQLSTPQKKISYLLNNISSSIQSNNNDNDINNLYWLANTNHKHHEITINPNNFLPPTEEYPTTWVNDPQLFYDPRFALSLYLESMRFQLVTKNPQNLKSEDHLIQFPFSWSDWVDLTMLNAELSKPWDQRRDCTWIQSKINKPTKYPEFCQNLKEINDEDLEKLPLPKNMLPGFLVKNSPMNKAPHTQVMMQGKAHLLVFQNNPLNIIFLTKSGTYEAQILPDSKRIHHTDMFKDYLIRKDVNIDSVNDVHEITLNPLAEFNSLLNEIPSRPLDPNDDIYQMRKHLNDHKSASTREIYLNQEVFHYQQDEVNTQIGEYEIRLNNLHQSYTNELKYNEQILQVNSLSRHELNHYQGLKYSNQVPNDSEPTYYKLSTLLKNSHNRDAGWHYEWRFFNGALRYIKDDTWTTNQLELREQIILDRLLRNWFKFASEKGIISWIAHGPLLSWYWDGLMFPFDVDIDIQMPSSELNRLSKSYNQTLVIENINEGFGKYFIDCSTFIHHRDRAVKDNHIDARFIDIDTGTYIDITGVGKNNEIPPPEYDSYIKHKNSKGESVELYMDRRKHWLTFEKLNPLRYSMIGGVPVYVPNDIMSMLNHEYSHGTSAFHYQGYYYVPMLRLWIHEKYLFPLFSDRLKSEQLLDKKGKVKVQEFSKLVKSMDINDKLRLLESNNHILIEYYLTHKLTKFHEIEKQLMLDYSLKYSLQDLSNNQAYHDLTSKFTMGTPLRKSLYDFEYFDRFEHEELLPPQKAP